MLRLALITLGLCIAVSGMDAHADTHALRFEVTKGQKVLRSEKMSLFLKGKGPDGPVELGREEVSEYEEEVLEVAEGQRARIRRKYLKYYEAFQAGDQTKTKDHPLTGKEVVLAIRDGKPVIISPDSVPAADVAEEKIVDPFNELMPRAAVAVGHKWTVDGEPVRRAMGVRAGDYKSGNCSGHFEAIEEKDGRKLAKIKIEMTVDVAVKAANLVMKMTVAGYLYIDLARRQPTGGKLTGPVTMTEGNLELKGTLTLNLTTTFK